jgi:hypothetical protein
LALRFPNWAEKADDAAVALTSSRHQRRLLADRAWKFMVRILAEEVRTRGENLQFDQCGVYGKASIVLSFGQVNQCLAEHRFGNFTGHSRPPETVMTIIRKSN